MSDFRIFICGNFGYKDNQLDGQTIKTRILKDELIRRISEENIIFTDTSYIKTRPFYILNQIRKNYKKSNYVIMMPDRRALKVLLPFFIKGNKDNYRDIRYVVIGGWLPSFLYKNKLYRDLVSELDGVYVETMEMKENMFEMGLKNTSLLANFRNFDFIPNKPKEVKIPLKLVYFSRVLQEKGIELAIEAVRRVNEKEGKRLVTLDIYGPIQKEYNSKFHIVLNNQGDDIAYKGALQPNEIHMTLSEYDLMIFPTYFKSEGLPGAIIDAYISGVPVLASNWIYNKEFIIEDITGKLFKSKDVDDLVSKIGYFIDNKEIILDMREYCMKEALKYHVNNLIPKLISDMQLEYNNVSTTND